MAGGPPARWTWSIGPPWTDLRAPFDLGRPCPSDGPGRTQATGGGETAGPAAERRQSSPTMAGKAFPCSKSREKDSGRKRGRWGGSPWARRGRKSTGGGDRGGAPAGVRSSSGGAAAVREERRGGARGGEEVLLPLYRVEGEVERAR
jgi:hypothetical protein